ncbi:class I SAM-dependent methyltransferase [Evansella halocellulosilytica]|uniref:class I SAM-dependent methyltransferase n=1 Tax=Evansella halocellulosilytica TaxID=2011013 RepID=UPI000BB88A75|nr:class I SAM-dependent methyltransferase [Evansella halocellulosilytica]
MSDANVDRKWEESDSEQFLKYDQALVPYRDKLEAVFIGLLPEDKQAFFKVVDICVGGGWLTESILTNYPNAHVIALDGSDRMIEFTKNRLNSFRDRVSFQKFDLFEEGWTDNLAEIDFFVSSLAIHHLDDRGKQQLFRRLYLKMNDFGRVIIADIIKPEAEKSRIIAAREWDEIIKEQSINLYGSLEAFDFFDKEKWNIFYYPDDEVDKPSTISDQIKWLAQAGFEKNEVLFSHAGHALFSGMKG